MGCDGGSIPRRDEMVKLKKKAEKADRDVELAAKWRHCALSAEKLKEPIVACDLGRLYNKECVLMALLDKSNIPEVASHIRNLKDVVELKLTVNPGYKPSDKADGYNDVQAARYVCPVTGLEMSGRYRFAFLRGCGCVLSERALKEVPSETCHKCGAPFKSEDVAIINGTEEDVKRQREAMEERRLQAKQAKMAKRKRKTESPPESESSDKASTAVACASDQSTSSTLPKVNDDGLPEASGSTTTTTCSGSPPAEKRPKLDTAATASGVTSTSKLVNGSSKIVGKASKLSSRHSGSSRSASSSRTVNGHSSGSSSSTLRSGSAASVVVKKATQEINTSFTSASKDPNAREAYKALFHSKDKERPKEKSAHWVTFFPYH